jgi:DNA-directed RNA polymerase specialized sigma subunit
MNSSHELMDEGHTDQIIALVRAQILENMLNRAIEALDATHRVREREEEDLRDLIAKASEQLGRQPGISTEDLANTLQVDVEDLAEALEAGVQRQVLDVHHRYTPRAPDPSMPTAATDAPPEDEEPPETAAPDS